ERRRRGRCLLGGVGKGRGFGHRGRLSELGDRVEALRRRWRGLNDLRTPGWDRYAGGAPGLGRGDGLDGGPGAGQRHLRGRIGRAGAERNGGQDGDGEAPRPALGSTHEAGAQSSRRARIGALPDPVLLGQTRCRSDSRASGRNPAPCWPKRAKTGPERAMTDVKLPRGFHRRGLGDIDGGSSVRRSRAMTAKTRFRGSFTALVTPFKNGSVDEKAFRDLVEWQIGEGTHGLVPVGTTGESPTLSHDEHKKVVEWCVGEAKGRVPVV